MSTTRPTQVSIKSRQAESSRANATYHVAVVYAGVKAYAEVYDTYSNLDPSKVRTTAGYNRFKQQAKQTIDTARTVVKEISLTHYRLQRALWTDSTVTTGSDLRPVKASTLRKDFEGSVAKHAPIALRTNHIPDLVPGDPADDSVTVGSDQTYKPYKAASFADDFDVQVEKLFNLDKALNDSEADYTKEFDSIFDNIFKKTAPTDPTIKEDNAKNARVVSGHAARLVQNASRAQDMVTGSLDKKVLGFVRVHVPEGDIAPCGFCALLMSRGAVYKTEGSAALVSSQFDEFHSGCHCQVFAVYDMNFYKTDDRFAANREYRTLWDQKFKGQFNSHQEAIAAWRKHFLNLKAEKDSRAKQPQEG